VADEMIARLQPLEHQAAPLRNKIIAALRKAIETGALQPGARLVERDLCGQLNVSRTSLREALRELQAEGVLFQTMSRGLTVGIVTIDDARNAYRIRSVLEALVVEQFIERANDEDIRHLVRQSETLKAAYRSADLDRILISKRAFYDSICLGAANALAFDIINRLVLRTSSLRSRSLRRKERQLESITEIETIVQAILRRDASAAKQAALRHVENSAISALGPVAGEAPAATVMTAKVPKVSVRTPTVTPAPSTRRKVVKQG
jgi:DNA-binding GntR family transcriptional regulator